MRRMQRLMRPAGLIFGLIFGACVVLAIQAVNGVRELQDGGGNGSEGSESAFDVFKMPEEPTCWEWDTFFRGYDVDDAQPNINIRGPYDCQRGCQYDERCLFWSYGKLSDERGGCYYKTSNAGREEAIWVDTAGNHEEVVVSGSKYSTDCDRGSIVSSCYQYGVGAIMHNILTIDGGIRRQEAWDYKDNATVHDCHARCHAIAQCEGFSFHPRYPSPDREGKLLSNVCFLLDNTRVRVCMPGVISGDVDGHDCGPPDAPFPPAHMPPFDAGGMHMTPADPSLYFGLPVDANSRALGKKGTKEERGYHRGDRGIPPFLNVSLPYAVKADEPVENCGCYHIGLQPDPNTATVLQSLLIWHFPPGDCQIQCQLTPLCEAFQSVVNECVLWANVTSWVADQSAPISVSGPRQCPQQLIEEGYVCNVDHYRARYGTFALLVLRVPNVSMGYGQSCPFNIDFRPFVILLAVWTIVLVAFAYALHRRKQNGQTVIWRVLAAVIAGLGSIVHVLFVASMFRFGHNGLLFWIGAALFVARVLFNEASVVIYNMSWVLRNPTYRRWFERSSTIPKKPPSDTETFVPVKKAVTFDASIVMHTAGPRDSPKDGDVDDVVSYCPTFSISELSSAAVFPPSLHQHEPSATESGAASVKPSESTKTCILTEEDISDSRRAVPCETQSVPCFTPPAESSGGGQDAETEHSSSGGKHATLSRKSLSHEWHATLSRKSLSREWEGDTVQGEGDTVQGQRGSGLVLVFFASFFSIGVLHIMWSKLADLPFLSTPVASDAFASLELLSLVGDVPICIVQLLTLFLSGGDGALADSVPPLTLSALALSAVNILGVIVRFVLATWPRGQGKGEIGTRQNTGCPSRTSPCVSLSSSAGIFVSSLSLSVGGRPSV
ncbi:unnamed protein product [Vitrella brassicaformis CCMP3155]|uniref:Apple domain-containing protein n=3 Tax=Vitrella brassicaformis TaxID=1169539 RepID=A0A0G4EDY9_VITBC|nr:unnamed protein product [Vitrella brassicaformis CCMP3155]|eukprot:CEL94195.1 unnamed protein product [Vitrella brassicaformis CCMP3155]